MMQEEQRLRKWQRRQFSRVGLVAVGFMVIRVLAQVIVVPVFNMIWGAGIDLHSGAGFVVGLAVPMYVIAFPLSAALFQLIPKCGTTQKQYWGFGKFAACLVVTLGLGLAGGALGQLVEWLKPWGSSTNGLYDIFMNSALWSNVLVAVIMAPVVEELFFRKLVMDRLLGFGEGPAILMSGLMFGMAHGNFFQFFYAFGIGILWAYVYAKTGKVSYTIAGHMIFNFLNGVITVELNKAAKGGVGSSWLLQGLEHLLGLDLGGLMAALGGILVIGYSVFIVACLIGGIIILILYRKNIHLLPGPWPIQKKRGFQTVVLNVGMIIYFLMCAGMFLMN